MHNAIPSIFLPLLVEVLEKGGVRFALGGGSVSITRLHTDLENALALWLSQRSYEGALCPVPTRPGSTGQGRPLLRACSTQAPGGEWRGMSQSLLSHTCLPRQEKRPLRAQHQKRNAAHEAAKGGTVLSLLF